MSGEQEYIPIPDFLRNQENLMAEKIQDAINAALEGIEAELDASCTYSFEGRKTMRRIIRSRINTNPLAEAQAKIAELERELAQLKRDCNVAGPEFSEKYKDLKGV